MIECSVQKIKKSFGANTIFENISFEVKTGEKIGMIGPNGVGKTTILKILMGKENCEGTITFRKGVVPGYLEQEPSYDDSYTCHNVLMTAFDNITEIADKMNQLEKSMMTPDVDDNIMDEYARLQEEYEYAGGYDMEEKFSKVTTGLGIDSNMLDKQFNKLSGGEQTKVMLGKILMQEPVLLLLDEPSNHLDLDTLQWLEQYISSYKGAVLIVSHDRYFLDKSVTKIIELSQNEAYVYHGNYTHFVEEKKLRYEQALKEYMINQKHISRVKEQIKRYRIWGTMRDSDKMFKRAKELERRLDKMEVLDKPQYENKKIRLNKNDTKRSGKDIVIIENVAKRFDSKQLFSGIDFNIYFGNRVSILGANGCGKSTLLKILLGEVEPDDGQIRIGSNVNIGYLAQSNMFENPEKTILEYFQYHYNIDNSVARSELAKVQFTGYDVMKKIKVLSGGERSRLRLCMLFYENVNLLVLDEPTNHLDIESREVLEDMLLDYKGTIIFVSHDRYFISKLAERVIHIENMGLSKYEGDYEYYVSQRKKEVVESQQSPKKQKSKPIKAKPKEDDKKALEKKAKLVESKIADIESQLDKIDSEMQKYADDAEKLMDLQKQKDNKSDVLDELYDKWDKLNY